MMQMTLLSLPDSLILTILYEWINDIKSIVKLDIAWTSINRHSWEMILMQMTLNVTNYELKDRVTPCIQWCIIFCIK
jgi:hypothetical protein